MHRKFGPGNPEERGSLERLRCEWEDNKVSLKEIGCDDVDWIHLVEDRD
jgi:hypothetical protein